MSYQETKLMDLKAGHMILEAVGKHHAGMIYEETESAPIASFSDGADGMLVKTLTVDIDPVQDLHGYDNPWPAGGGANIWNEEWEQGAINGGTGQNDVNNNKIRSVGYIPVLPNTSYYFKHTTVAVGAADLFMYASDKSYLGYYNYSVHESKEITTPADAYYMRFSIIGTTYNHDIAVNYPATVTTYSPYSNVCPISGWDSANVSRTGKNLFDKDNVNSINAYFGGNNPFIFVSGSSFRTVYIPCKPSTTYTVKNNAITRLFIGYTNKTPVAGDRFEYAMSTQNGVGTITTGSDAKYLCCYVHNSNVDTVTFAEVCAGLMLELGSTASTYKPYSGSTAEYEFPQEAGTVYGGTLTIHQDGTGELVVDRTYKEITSETNIYRNTDHAFYTPVSPSAKASGKVIADRFKSIESYSYDSIFINSSGDIRFNTLEAYSTGNAFKTAFVGTQIVYELATPVTYQLTNQQVLTLLKGNNVCFADCGAVSLEYPADTKLYIDGKIAEIQALILENISNS